MEHMLIAGCLLDCATLQLHSKSKRISIFYDMIGEIMEVFMDDFSVYGKTFNHCLENVDKVLQRCEEKHLVFN